MSGGGQLAVGALAGISCVTFLWAAEEWLAQLRLLLASLLWGATLAVLLLTTHGWVVLLAALPGLAVALALRRRRRQAALDVSLSSAHRVEAEALMARVRREAAEREGGASDSPA